jgi:hypothetical protein
MPVTTLDARGLPVARHAVSDLEANKREHSAPHHFPRRAGTGSTEDLIRLLSADAA